MGKEVTKTDQKLWYKTWWGITLIILSLFTFTFLVPLLVIMWQSKKFPLWAKIAVTVLVLPAIISAMNTRSTLTQPTITQTTTTDAQQAEQNRIKTEQESKALADKRQETINTLAPAYCKTHGDLKINETTLHQQGWPHANNSLGLSGEECTAIISKLYDQGTSPQELQTMAEDKVAIGMSKIEVVYTWGSPADINTTTSSNATQEQWVYGNPIYGATYVYFVNDTVTTIQN